MNFSLTQNIYEWLFCWFFFMTGGIFWVDKIYDFFRFLIRKWKQR